MAVKTYDDIIARFGAGFHRYQPVYVEQLATTRASQQNIDMHRVHTGAMPASLPTGVSGFVPTSMNLGSSSSATGTVLVGKLTSLGTFNASSNTFTDGSSMGTSKQLGTSGVASYSQIIFECTTASSASAFNISITYTDQDGNTGQSTFFTTSSSITPVGSCYYPVLDAGDIGVRDVTNVSCTANSGAYKIWGLTPIGIFPWQTKSIDIQHLNFLTNGFSWVKLGAGEELGIFLFQGGAKTTVGSIFIMGDS